MAQPDAVIVPPSALLELALRVYVRAGELEHAIAAELGVSEVRFWQAVNRLLDDPPADLALEHGPAINRLRRLRDGRQRQRQTAGQPSLA